MEVFPAPAAAFADLIAVLHPASARFEDGADFLRHPRTARPLGAIQLSDRQKPQPGRGRLSSARLQNCLAEFPPRPRQRISEVNGVVPASNFLENISDKRKGAKNAEPR